MGLTGLTPEQITSLGQLGQGQTALLANTAAALGGLREKQADREEAHRKIRVSLDGQNYDINHRDFPDMWSKIQTADRAADTQVFNLKDGAQFEVYRDQIPQMINSITQMETAPAQIAALSGQARQSRVSAEDTEATRDSRIAQNEAQTNYLDSLAGAKGEEIQDAQGKRDAIKALSGVPIEQWIEGDHAANAAHAFPGVTATAVNALASGRGDMMSNSDWRSLTKAGTDLSYSIFRDGAKTSDTDIASFNQIAAFTGLGHVIARDRKGVPQSVQMPTVGGQQIPIQAVEDILRRRGLSLQQVLEYTAQQRQDPQQVLQFIAEAEMYAPTAPVAPETPQAPLSP